VSDTPAILHRFLHWLDERRRENVAFERRMIVAVNRGLVRVGVRTTAGWIALLFIAAILAYAIYATAAFAFSGNLRLRPSSIIELWLFVTGCILYLISVCVVIIYALARRRVRKQRPGWRELALLGKVLHVLLVVAGTALFLSPFAWIAWRAMNR
jgi:multisubunit Na+/H+ antiporter MnhB subunit